MNDSYRLIEGMIKELMLEQAQQPQQPVADPKDLLDQFMNGIKGISTFELTDKVGAEMSNREYENLLFSSIEGADYEQKILKLQDILNSKGRYSVQNAKECLAAMSFAKIALKLIYDTNYRRSGYAFETLMAVLMGGKREESYGPLDTRSGEDFDIIDITSGDKRYSAKFIKEPKEEKNKTTKTMELKANIVNLYNEISKKGPIEYIYCVKKSVENPSKISLEFNKFVIDMDKFNIFYLPIIRSLGGAVNNTDMIDKQLAKGRIQFIPSMKDRFYNHMRTRTNQSGEYSGEIYGKDGEAIISVTLKNFMDLGPTKIATLNISTDNIRRMFGANQSYLLERYFSILTSLADLTTNTNKFIYGNTIGANTVIDSAGKLINNVNFVQNIIGER
jgi:hypothetical protein